MAYYILNGKVENENEDAILEGVFVDVENEDYLFYKGFSLEKKGISTPIVFKIEQYALRGTMTDHLSIDDINGPIFSQKVINLLKAHAVNNIEYYPLTIRDEFPEVEKTELQKNKKEEKKEIEYTNYFIANVVGLVDCINHEQSIGEYYYPPELRQQLKEEKEAQAETTTTDNPNEFDFITKLILDERKITPTMKVFRLLDRPDLLIFHDSIVEAIRKKNLSGFVFVPVTEYTDAITDEEEERMPAPKHETTDPVSEQPETARKEEPKGPKRKSGFSFLID